MAGMWEQLEEVDIRRHFQHSDTYTHRGDNVGTMGGNIDVSAASCFQFSISFHHYYNVSLYYLHMMMIEVIVKMFCFMNILALPYFPNRCFSTNTIMLDLM